MDKLIIQNMVQELFNRRIKDANEFWTNLKEDEVTKLFGTTKILDGDPRILEQLVQNRKHSDKDLYNLYRHYENHTKKRNYYKNGLINKKIIKQLDNKPLLKKVAIFLPHIAWTGGMKMIFKLGELLDRKGYAVDYFIPYKNTGKRFTIEIGPYSKEVITYENDEVIKDFSYNYDVAFATHWDQIFPLYKNFERTVFYAQGDYDTFSNKPEKIALLKLFYSLPVHHMGVSSFLSHLMMNNYNRKAWIVPCSIDMNKFHFNKETQKQNYILVVGDGNNVFKNTKETIENLIPIAEQLNTTIKWVTPYPGEFQHERVKIIINPEQNELVKIIQEAKVIVNGSLIESFSLPPLEAMSCGTPVVASNNMGILQYAVNNKNALLFPFKNYDLMREHVKSIFTNKEIEENLIREGLETAKDYEESAIEEINYELIENEFLVHRFIK